jgi:hypothetical protein
LQESGIPEAAEYAGFPVGGQFLVSENPDVVNSHLAKVYGQDSGRAADVGAAYRYPYYRWQTRAAVWTVRHLLNALFEKWLAVGSAALN